MNRVLLSNISDNLGIKSHRKSAAYPDHFIKTGFLIGKAINRDFIVFFDLRGFPQFSSRLNNLCVFVCVLDAWQPPPWKSWQRRDALSEWWHHPPSISRRRGHSRNSKSFCRRNPTLRAGSPLYSRWVQPANLSHRKPALSSSSLHIPSTHRSLELRTTTSTLSKSR